MPTSSEFRKQLDALFDLAKEQRVPSVIVEARYLHRLVGGYPNGGSHRMPVCCQVMRGAIQNGDVIVRAPPKGNGATFP